MPLTPIPGFSTLTILPSWDIVYSVEFHNQERQLGNNYLQITDGGTANPEEKVSLSANVTATASDNAIADLRSYQGSTAFNWRFFTGGNYKLYFCSSFSDATLGTNHDRFSAELVRHPDPQYDPQPATVVDGRPWGILIQPVKWGSDRSIQATLFMEQSRKGKIIARRAQSIFAAQNTIASQSVEFNGISEARMNAIDLFLRQRRGRIPFQFSTNSNAIPALLWICSRWQIKLHGTQNGNTDRLYSMICDFRQVFRGEGA